MPPFEPRAFQPTCASCANLARAPPLSDWRGETGPGFFFCLFSRVREGGALPAAGQRRGINTRGRSRRTRTSGERESVCVCNGCWRRRGGQTRPSRVHSQAVRLPGNPSGAARRRAAPRHTRSFFKRAGPRGSRAKASLVLLMFVSLIVSHNGGDQGSKKTNGARFHANFKLISRQILALISMSY